MDGLTYPSVEHAYQAAKFSDQEMRERVRTAPDPYAAKKIGKFANANQTFRVLRISIMRELVRYKFFNNSDLKAKLLATGDQEIIEGNNWNDTYWGRCGGVGENHLGKILMQVRSELRT